MPRLALFAPLSPKKSGIANYSEALARALRPHYAIDLYHDGGYIPEIGVSDDDFGCYDHRAFGRRAVAYGRRILTQMGASYHQERFAYEALLRWSGVVTLHDFTLAWFFWWRHHADGRFDFEGFLRDLDDAHPGRAAELRTGLQAFGTDPDGMARACAEKRLHFNRSVFVSASAVVVHSPWCRDQVRELMPEFLAKTHVVPLGATAAPLDADRRAALRRKFGLPADALVVGNYGSVHPTKMNCEAVAAFAAVARVVPTAVMIVVGPEADDSTRRRAEALGLRDRVIFFGPREAAEFNELVSVADLGMCLRRPPTYGETSGALIDMLKLGVPTVVVDTAAFGEYPADVVSKVCWDGDGMRRLCAAVCELALDAAGRAGLGRAAWQYVRDRHEWPRVAEQYMQVIEAA